MILRTYEWLAVSKPLGDNTAKIYGALRFNCHKRDVEIYRVPGSTVTLLRKKREEKLDTKHHPQTTEQI